MTIEEKVKILVNQICNEAVIYNGNPDKDVFVQAILALIEKDYVTNEFHKNHLKENKEYYENKTKPMSREKLAEIIETLTLVTCIPPAYLDRQIIRPEVLQLKVYNPFLVADAILAEWGKE